MSETNLEFTSEFFQGWERSIPQLIQQMVKRLHFFFGQGFEHLLKIFVDAVHRCQQLQALLGDQDIHTAPVHGTFAPVQKSFRFQLVHDPGSIAHPVKHSLLDQLHATGIRVLPPQDAEYIELLHRNVGRAEHRTVVRIQPVLRIREVNDELLGFAFELLLLYFVF